MNNLILL